ncbi:MAG: transposase [Caldilineaceae bacterium]|nr:transposase [Caldilineaceae bacterium]
MGRKPFWHSRGYLPHYENPAVVQHVTFHLADSLPKAALERMEMELQIFPGKRQEEERRKRIEALRDAGHGSCVLRIPEIAQMVQDALFYFDGQRYRLIAWVVMPNHVHVLFQLLHNWTVAKIVASWKKFTARKINEYQRRTDGSANREIGEAGVVANREIGAPNDVPKNTPNPVWQREYWDRYMRNEEHLYRAVEYIHQNPVKAGLVATVEEWPWSSAALGTAKFPFGQDPENANQEIGEPGSGSEKTQL